MRGHYLFEILTSIPLDIYPEVGFLDHSIFKFLRNLHIVFQSGYINLYFQIILYNLFFL